jgi:hypothetical protein
MQRLVREEGVAAMARNKDDKGDKIDLQLSSIASSAAGFPISVESASGDVQFTRIISFLFRTSKHDQSRH